MLQSEKKKNLMAEIGKLLDSPYGYLETEHAKQRMAERDITRQEIFQVLRSGRHDEKRDKFNADVRSWNYSICGRTLCDRELRLAVAVGNRVIIITAMEIQQ